MEMTYDGTLVMPSNYAVMDEEEMTYFEGGSLATLKSNLNGLYYIVSSWVIKRSLGQTAGQMIKASGLTLTGIAAMAGSYASLVYKVASIVSSVTAWLGAHVWAIACIGTVAAATLLWNVRIF